MGKNRTRKSKLNRNKRKRRQKRKRRLEHKEKEERAKVRKKQDAELRQIEADVKHMARAVLAMKDGVKSSKNSDVDIILMTKMAWWLVNHLLDKFLPKWAKPSYNVATDESWDARKRDREG